MKTVKAIAVVLLFVLMVIFVAQNDDKLSIPVDFQLNLYIKDINTGQIPLYSILLLCFFGGIFITGIVAWIHLIRLKGQVKRLTKDLQEKEKELNSLRNLPVLEKEASS
jgi:uncharacterized integral membrane protein